MIELGIDNLLKKEVKKYKGKIAGLVTNMTAINRQCETTLSILSQSDDILLKALFAPEHGIHGHLKEGESFDHTKDEKTGLPVFSLYKEGKFSPSKEMLADLDVVFFDIQDAGSRYFTFIYTMANMMLACRDYDITFVVLDRPNPINGVNVEGNLVKEDCRSFVGQYPIPNRHGMTVAELALYFNHSCDIECSLDVIPMTGWNRSMLFVDTQLIWVQPTPNTTRQDMLLLYPGTCMFEGTNLSLGRGTTLPFEVIGAPFVDGEQLANHYNAKGNREVVARPTSFIPTRDPYTDQLCKGVQLHVLNRTTFSSLKVGLDLLASVMRLFPVDFEFVNSGTNNLDHFDRLAGTKLLKDILRNGNEQRCLESCEEESREFEIEAKPYKIY